MAFVLQMLGRPLGQRHRRGDGPQPPHTQARARRAREEGRGGEGEIIGMAGFATVTSSFWPFIFLDAEHICSQSLPSLYSTVA